MSDQTRETVIFPWFEYENHDGLPIKGLSKMLETLQHGGFIVHSVFDVDGQILHPLVSSVPVNHILFEVSLPSGWKLEQGYTYGQPDPEVMDLVDEQNRLRGRVDLEEGGDGLRPQKGEIYCRYAVPRLPGLCKFPIDRPPDFITDIIVDRAAVDRKQPWDFPVVVFFDRRPARVQGDLSSEELEIELVKCAEEQLERMRTGKPLLDPPIYKWLHENYPDWLDPFAYW